MVFKDASKVSAKETGADFYGGSLGDGFFLAQLVCKAVDFAMHTGVYNGKSRY